MHFLKLTARVGKGYETFVNMDQVAEICVHLEDKKKGVTSLYLRPEGIIRVKETPAEIMEKLREEGK